MSKKVQFPSAIHEVRVINDNIVRNMLAGRVSYINRPSIYERAYAVVYETGEYSMTENILAPDEKVSQSPRVRILSVTK